MDEYKTLKTLADSCDVDYRIDINRSGSKKPFGITATLKTDSSDTASVTNVFFSQEEATACCKWLAENNVYPVTLNEVISDLYHLTD